MDRPKKWVLRIVLAVVVVVIVAVVLVVIYIDSVARTGVERGGTYALGVDTTLDAMDVGVLSGSVEMAKLEVGNPEGFDTPHFLRLDSGRVVASLGSLMKEKIIVPELTLSGISMNLERKRGKANYKVIMDNLKRFESKEDAAPEEQKEGKKFIINELAIRDIQVQVDLLPVAGERTRVPVKIERIEMANVGSDGDEGIALAELVGILTKAILTAVVENAGDRIPADIAGELGTGLAGLTGLGGGTMEVVGQVTTGTGEAAKKVGQRVEGAGKTLKKGLGGLLDRGKGKEEDQEDDGK